MVLYECRKRLLDSKTINLHRYAAKAIYCSSISFTGKEIEIGKYDFAENKWDKFKSISLKAARYGSGSIFLNGELFVMGGRNSPHHYSSVSIRNYCVFTKS